VYHSGNTLRDETRNICEIQEWAAIRSAKVVHQHQRRIGRQAGWIKYRTWSYKKIKKKKKKKRKELET
jgi:hypothetical protein